MRRKVGHHPHYGGHRSGGLHVGANAKRSGPQPGQTEFSPQDMQAMQAQQPAAAPAAPGPAAGGTPGMTGGSPVPQDMDQDGGI